MSKPQCQFCETHPDLPRCTAAATRKWGDVWLCDEHGKRDKAPPPPAPTVTSIPPPSESLHITTPGLDPITALLYDLKPGEGRVILECYGEALAGYWPAMGPKNIRQFIAACDADYLAGRMIPPDTTKRRIAYLRRVVSAFQTAIRSLP